MAPKPKPKKVEINYPPVTTKKWKPPNKPHVPEPLKRKPITRKPEFPHTEKIHPSSLEKIWHRYKMLSSRAAILFGDHSQCSERFPIKIRGKQGPANCFVAIGYSKMKEMQNWDCSSIGLILQTGNKLYQTSVRINKATCRCTSPKEVHNTFFIQSTQVVLGVENDDAKGTLYKVNDSPCLFDEIRKMFTKTDYCILEVDGLFFAMWKSHGAYYVFDPNDRDNEGQRCREGTGTSVVLKFVDISALLNDCWDNCGPPNVNLGFTLTPIYIKKFDKKNLDPPSSIKEVVSLLPKPPRKIPPKSCLATKVITKPVVKNLPLTKLPQPGSKISKPKSNLTKRNQKPEKTDVKSEIKSNTPSLTRLVDAEKIGSKTNLVPIEKPKPPSVTYFRTVVPNKFGIIHASYHQNDSSYSKFYGKQSLANAIGALTMLRQHKSKLWFPKILDEILLTGETIYLDSRKNLVGDQVLDLHSITDKVKMNKKFYKPEIEETTIIGKLNSNKLNVLDLLPALEEFFTDNDTGIIRGPQVLAVWSEEGKYYMFDPNERDKTGKTIQKSYKLNNYEETSNPGYACLTWFFSLRDLVSLYMENIEKSLRREHFFISRVEIKDYVELPSAWNNFHALRLGKWILRGTISQNNPRFSSASRNTQCTAIATFSIAYMKIKNPCLWERDTIDEIVVQGDTFYLKCVDVLRAKGKLQDKMLMMAEIVDKHSVLEKELNIEIEDCIINGLVNVSDDFEFPNLKKGFQEFFKDNDCGVVTARGLSVAIWRDDDAYYYFDSHSRDENGYSYYGGTACVLRLSTIEDLARIMAANLGAGTEDLYNISRVEVTAWEKTPEGTVKPNFYQYTELSPKKGILRGSSHQGNSELFDIYADKQTIPNMLTSFGMAAILPCHLWDKHTVDEILTNGNKLYANSRNEIIKKDLENMSAWDDNSVDFDVVDVENVMKEFHIGVNKIEVKIGQGTEGVFESDVIKRNENGLIVDAENELKSILREAMTSVEGANEESKNEIIIDCDLITLAIWKENGLFYVFDPKGKDPEGNFFGRELWSAKIILDYEGEEMLDDMGYNENIGAGDNLFITNQHRLTSATNTEVDTNKMDEELQVEEEEENEEDALKDYAKITQSYDITDTKACVIMFTTFNELFLHIIENIPPNKRTESFKLYPVSLTARADLKIPSNPVDKSLGNWHEFVEIDKYRWILRGTLNMHDKMYPELNRGKQFASMCVTACVFGRLYALPKYKPNTVDNLMKYGDRLHTVIRKEREKEMRENKALGLSDAEIFMILSGMALTTSDTPKQFYLGEYLVCIEVVPRVVDGDITVEDKRPEVVEVIPPPVVVETKPIQKGGKPIMKEEKKEEAPPTAVIEEPVLSLRKGIRKFFDQFNYGVLSAKETSVSIWKLFDFFYMFDPESRGPRGLQEVNGRACITRFANMEDLINVFEHNLTKGGSNTYTIDYVKIKSREAKRPSPEVATIIPTDPKVTAFQTIPPGKMILRGSFHQDNPKFGLSPNAAAATNAIAALAMAQIHKPETWTKPIVDEVVTNGYLLFKSSVKSLGCQFNTWEDKLGLDLVLDEFNIGVMNNKWEINIEGMKKGILDTKNPNVANLRKGCQEFFFECNQGVIQSECLTTAIWLDKELYYMFDPNPRSSTGIFSSGGTSCLLVFKSIKLLTDHFLLNIPADLQNGEYTIWPIEITVNELKEPKKPLIKKADLLKVKEIDSLASADKENETKPKKPVKKDPKSPCVPTDKKKSPKKPAKENCRCDDQGKIVTHKKLEMNDSKISPGQKKQWGRDKSEAKNIKLLQIYEQRMRKEFFGLDNGNSIVRAHYSQNSERFNICTRNKQTIPNALVAIVMFKLHEPNTWSYKNIEIILDSADVLYKDSYIKYRPTNPLLGLKNILRTFYILHLKISTVIYKAGVFGDVRYEDLYVGLLNFFMQETAGILFCDRLTVAIFQKAGQFFMFDPHDRDATGSPTKSQGAACLLRFPNVENLVDKYLTNSGINGDTDIVPRFTVYPVIIEGVQRTEE